MQTDFLLAQPTTPEPSPIPATPEDLAKAPPKRKRGRPPKPKLDALTYEPPPVKRGRGRPPRPTPFELNLAEAKKKAKAEKIKGLAAKAAKTVHAKKRKSKRGNKKIEETAYTMNPENGRRVSPRGSTTEVLSVRLRATHKKILATGAAHMGKSLSAYAGDLLEEVAERLLAESVHSGKRAGSDDDRQIGML